MKRFEPHWAPYAVAAWVAVLVGFVIVREFVPGGMSHAERINFAVAWVLGFAALGVVVAVVAAVRRARAVCAQRTGRCVHCGYDLRASPERCPECGEDRAADAE